MELINVKKNIKKISIIKKGDILHLIIAFMLGRVFLIDAVSPFAMAYFCSFMNVKTRNTLKIIITVILSVAGAITAGYTSMAIRYLLAYVLFGLIYISVSTIRKVNRQRLCQYSAVLSMALSGIIYYAQISNFTRNMLILVLECVICYALPYILDNSADIICCNKIFTEISPKDIGGICTISILTLGGFFGIHIGDMSLGKVLSGVFIMILAYTGKCSLTASCGVCIGVLFSLYSFDYNEYTGILGFCGLITGLASGFKRPGIILSFIISTRLLTLYFGGWSDSVFTYFESIVAVCMFCLIPESILFRIKAYFNSGIIMVNELKKCNDIINIKLKTTSVAFENLASLSKKVLYKIPETTADPSTIYDCAAGRICRHCGLKFICWDKEAFDTRDILNKTVSILCKKGKLYIEDVPVEFKQKCIKYQGFIDELNRVYFKYKTNCIWQEKVRQGNNVITTQLQGISDIMQDFSKNLGDSITFDKIEESKIMYEMEQADIRCTDVTVVNDFMGEKSVTVSIRKKRVNFTQLCKIIEDIVSETTNKPMTIESYNTIKNKYVLKLKEAERFSVTCSYISIPKKGETVCGDNVIHSRISGNKYVMLLSDGMGCGEDAAAQSITAIEMLEQFLNAGFDKKTSVEMINSTLMLRDSETFATIDAVIFDLFTGHTEFIKAGANITYIKSEDAVKKIVSKSLPIGIISGTKAEINEYQAKKGDIIILISDGIQNVAEDWFEEYLLNIHEDNPSIIASLLADEAKRHKEQNDDMTVAVLKINKNEENLYV